MAPTNDAKPTVLVETGPKDYSAIRTPQALAEWIARLNAAELVAVDTETTGLDPMTSKLVGLSFAVAPLQGAYLPLRHVGPAAGEQLDFDATLAQLKPWLEDDAKKKVGQNLKYDRHIFANHGIALDGVLHDT